MNKYFNHLVLVFIFSTWFLNPMFQTATGQTLPEISFGEQTLQIHPYDHDAFLPWGRDGVAVGSNSIADGRINTQGIVNKFGNWNQGNYAANVCARLNAFGYDDWYLPSATELAHILENRNGLEGSHRCQAIGPALKSDGVLEQLPWTFHRVLYLRCLKPL